MNASVIPPSPSAQDYDAQLAANGDESIFERDDPIALFIEWLEAAKAGEINDANAMALATVDGEGMPDVRMVLLKDVDGRGFTFYSNQESAKGQQLAGQPMASLLFHWKSLRRQVRIRGQIEPVSAAEADEYFASRARESRIGAWVSDQSRPLESREALEAKVAEKTAEFEGQEVERPAHWSGWRVLPQTIEFWRDRPFRLHDRLVFTRHAETWETQRLWP